MFELICDISIQDMHDSYKTRAVFQYKDYLSMYSALVYVLPHVPAVLYARSRCTFNGT